MSVAHSFASINKSILKALFNLMSAAFLIRLAGMLNQIVVTAQFGGGPAMDAYFVAAMIPLLLSLLLNDAIEASVIPVYVRLRAGGNREQISLFFNTLLNSCMLGATVCTLLMLVFRSQLLFISAPALDAFRIGVALDLAPFLFPCFWLMTTMGFLESVLNAEGQFGWPAYGGLLVPVSTAALVLLSGHSLGIVVLGLGMLIGLILRSGILLVRMRLAGIPYRPVLSLRLPEVRLVLALAWPVLLGAIATQALPFFDQVVASYLSPGSISALNYANKLISVPVGVVFVSFGRAVLPYLSHQRAVNDMSAFKKSLRLSLWGCGIISLLVVLFLLVFAHPLVRLLFQRGAFSAEDTARTVSALLGFTVGLMPLAIDFLLAKAFSALGKTRVLMGITLFGVVANTCFDILFAHFWQEFGIALATSLVYICTMCIMLFILRRKISPFFLFTFPPEISTMLRIPAGGKRE